jgi:hypothetical protein
MKEETANSEPESFSLFLSSSSEYTICDEDLADRDQTILLGHAGSGKSFVLLKSFELAIERFRRDGNAPFPILLDCSSHLPVSNDFEDSLRTQSSHLYDRIQEEHPPGAYLFIDEVDTKIRQTPSFANDLSGGILSASEKLDNLRFLITTRRSEWNRLNSTYIHTWVDTDDIYTFSGTRETYRHILKHTDRRQEFFQKVRSRGLQELLDRPFDGFELARSFLRTEEIPEHRTHYLEERINALECLQKSDPVHMLGSSR